LGFGRHHKWRGAAALAAAVASTRFYLMSSIFPGAGFESWGMGCMFFSGLLAAIFALLSSTN